MREHLRVCGGVGRADPGHHCTAAGTWGSHGSPCMGGGVAETGVSLEIPARVLEPQGRSGRREGTLVTQLILFPF